MTEQEIQHDAGFFNAERQLFKAGDPLQFVTRLDTRPKKSVNLATYNPVSSKLPDGFGRWSCDQKIFGERYRKVIEQCKSGYSKHAELPSAGTNVVVKMGLPGSIALQEEFMALSKTNELFDASAKSRAVRLVGYGEVQPETDGPNYLLLEHISDTFTPLHTYLPPGRRLDTEEAIKIASGISEVLAISHKAQICHGELDLIKDHGLAHIYWNRQDEALRLIDWNAGTDGRVDSGAMVRAGYKIDRSFVGHILFRALTGMPFDIRQYKSKIKDVVSDATVSDKLIGMIGQAVGDREVATMYESTPEGTHQMHQDLLHIIS